MDLTGKNLFNIILNSGIVQTKINTPKTLKTMCALAKARSKGAQKINYEITITHGSLIGFTSFCEAKSKNLTKKMIIDLENPIQYSTCLAKQIC